ncbi:hypothetical protein [Conexibacter arvalis]|uniref:Uncharacterized protein n=1 Tax=Conexibacter arvalis TaxID=912552 RepID=A0A840IF24_9ACTN|nr:hypothetical protein [Conexibacter arvalis]MBB4663429.1 hypothetical protein [Conexibacter arvalis]
MTHPPAPGWIEPSEDERYRPFEDDDLEEWWRGTGYDELRELLLWRWDPIGVAEWFPDAANEYHDFGRPIVRLLASRARADRLAEHLHEVARDHIGTGDPSVVHPSAETRRAAEEIVAWFPRSRHRWREFGTPARPPA